MIQLLPEERASLAQYIHSACAIALDESKSYLIQSRLSGVAEAAGCGTFLELLLLTRSDPGGALERRIVEAITTGETSFFRDAAPFDLLRAKLVPELVDRQTRDRAPRLRIWSAACSTGQELYSIAILLKELLGSPERYGVRLLGTDISDQAVARASRGVYTPIEMSRGLSESLRAKYFLPAEGGWQIRDEIRAMVSFKRINLMKDFAGLGRFDVIFCRNVAIYFSDEDRRALFGRMEQALERGGSLVVGAMESLAALCPQFESKRHMRCAYYQLKGAPALAKAQAGASPLV